MAIIWDLDFVSEHYRRPTIRVGKEIDSEWNHWTDDERMCVSVWQGMEMQAS